VFVSGDGRWVLSRSTVTQRGVSSNARLQINIGWTHPEAVNKALLEFVDQRDKKLAGT
jgi:hypothetical protein